MVEVRHLSIDDFAAVRYVHTAAVAALSPSRYAPADVKAFSKFVRSPRYADLLLGNPSYAAWIDNELIGTAAWSPGEAPSPTARILGVFVQPLFAGAGVGRLLVERVESEALATGYRALNLSATLNAEGFFDALGYRVTGQGGWALPSGHKIPWSSCASFWRQKSTQQSDGALISSRGRAAANAPWCGRSAATAL
jgi:GNAT superfamily N-acetyltransferase